MTNKARYQKLIQQIPDFPVFAYDWYLDSVCGAGTWDVVFLEKEGQDIGAFPYFLKKKGPFKYITMPPLCKFMGPYLLPEFQNQPAYIQALFDRLPSVSSFTQNFHYSVATNQTFPLKALSPKTFFSYRLQNIEDLETTRSKLARHYRNSILRKAPETLTIRHDLGVEAYYEINRKTYARQEMDPPFSLDLLRKNVVALEKNKAGKIFFVVDEQERIHAAALLVWDQQTAWYHSAGGDPELRKSGAGIYVVWEMIRFASSELGLKQFDFAGSMIPAIEKLWLNFGAARHEYYHLEHHFSKLFVASQKAMEVLKKNQK